MNILITGGAGFIGLHLARFHAARGDQVAIFDNFFKGGHPDGEFETLCRLPNVRFYNTDLTQPIAHDGAGAEWDLVYHLAAINGTRLFYEIPYTVARTNLLATLNLLDWLKRHPAKKVVYTSSSEVYADAGKVGLLKIPTSEEVPVVFTQPTHIRFSYGTSKFMGEMLCQAFAQTEGRPISIVRYHNIYGPRMGNKHVIPEFILRVLNEENPFVLYGGDETRAFCYIDDAVRATWLVGNTAACDNQILHIGNPNEEVTMAQLAACVMKSLNRQTPLEDRGGRGGSVARRCPNTDKIRTLTGYEPRVDLNEGLRQTTAWYRDHYSSGERSLSQK